MGERGNLESRSVEKSEMCKLHTHSDSNLVRPRPHHIIIIPTVQLCEGGKTGCAHPILEVEIGLQVGDIIVRVAIWEAFHPVWGRYNVTDGVVAIIADGRRGILLGLARPRNIVSSEVVGSADTARRVQ